jgi:hypothetical protein
MVRLAEKQEVAIGILERFRKHAGLLRELARITANAPSPHPSVAFRRLPKVAKGFQKRNSGVRIAVIGSGLGLFGQFVFSYVLD